MSFEEAEKAFQAAKLEANKHRIPVWTAYVIRGNCQTKFHCFGCYRNIEDCEKDKKILREDYAFIREELLAADGTRYLPNGQLINTKNLEQFKNGLLNDGINQTFLPVTIEWANDQALYVLATTKEKRPEKWTDMSDCKEGIVINFVEAYCPHTPC